MLVILPSMALLLLQSIFYIVGRRKEGYNYGDGSIEGLISIIIPVRMEPLELLDEALRYIYELGKYYSIEAIVVSDDPRDRIEEIKDIILKWKERGLNISFIWREYPRGYRTGALNDALSISRGKYIYVMDVDSRISKDFFAKAVKLVNEGAVAVVARWKGRNRDTRLSEAISASMDYIVDAIYRGRSRLGLPVFPVGTGTLYDSTYLKATLREWDEERIQDDMEIGARIMKLGGRVLYIDEEYVEVEVPRTFKSFRIQQERWAYGATDVALARFTDILFSKQPLYARIEALSFLLQYMPLLLGFIGLVLIAIAGLFYNIDVFLKYWFLGIIWVVIACFYSYSYLSSQRERGTSYWRALVNLGRISATTLALTPVVSKAIFKALLRIKIRYKRTPKRGQESIWSGLRMPIELVLGIIIFMLSILFITQGIVYTGFWMLSYSLGFLYTFIRWPRDILFK
ncbi:MAG: glycosyltransferase family 2 protein [Desulfurococcales archaeon]|nr:glycosyltransferase family 2 protein [Desulfurococcales archaeon]